MLTERDYLEMMKDTSELVAQAKAGYLQGCAEAVRPAPRGAGMSAQAASAGGSAAAFQQSASLANDVEFWKWMGANYPRHLGNPQMIQQVAEAHPGWLQTQLQGKGYEWDFMAAQRANPSHLLSRFHAGNSPTQPGIDVTETNLLHSSTATTYQNKAYLGKTSPNLHNTPKDAIVVTNQEKVAYAAKKGYQTEEFMDSSSIAAKRDARFQQARTGKAAGAYTAGNIAVVSARAGIVGAVIGMTAETVACYRSWKNGEITNEQYLKQVLSAGGDAGVTAGLTAAAMVPVQAAIAAAGASTLLALPVAFVFGAAINAIVAPCFGRGKYREILGQAKYYQALEDGYEDFIRTAEYAAAQYTQYVQTMSKQAEVFEKMQQADRHLNSELKALYDSI